MLREFLTRNGEHESFGPGPPSSRTPFPEEDKTVRVTELAFLDDEQHQIIADVMTLGADCY